MQLADRRLAGKVDKQSLSSIQMQHGLLYLFVYTHRFAVPAMLDMGATWSFVSRKFAAKLPAIV